MRKVYVHVLAIDHRFGTNISAHRTEDSARKELLTYVRTWWPVEMLGHEVPKSVDDEIREYFEVARGGEESYLLRKAELQ